MFFIIIIPFNDVLGYFFPFLFRLWGGRARGNQRSGSTKVCDMRQRVGCVRMEEATRLYRFSSCLLTETRGLA